MFDCCIINHELDLLEIRLNTLDCVVEKFVIVESPMTHSGKFKKMHFTENRERFRKWEDKIIHLVYHGYYIEDPANQTQIVWHNENEQRNYVLKALDQAIPSDWLLYISDVDEIPRPEKLLEAKRINIATQMPVNFALEQCMYFLNYNFKGFKQIRGSYLYDPRTAKEMHMKHFNSQHHSPSAIRWHMVADGYENDFPTVHDAGWHFSTLGSYEDIIYKIESNAHRFCDTDEFKNRERVIKIIQDGGHVYDMDRYKDTKLVAREIEFLPLYVQANLEKFDKYIMK